MTALRSRTLHLGCDVTWPARRLPADLWRILRTTALVGEDFVEVPEPLAVILIAAGCAKPSAYPTLVDALPYMRQEMFFVMDGFLRYMARRTGLPLPAGRGPITMRRLNESEGSYSVYRRLNASTAQWWSTLALPRELHSLKTVMRYSSPTNIQGVFCVAMGTEFAVDLMELGVAARRARELECCNKLGLPSPYWTR